MLLDRAFSVELVLDLQHVEGLAGHGLFALPVALDEPAHEGVPLGQGWGLKQQRDKQNRRHQKGN